jgi:hypothetical protein
VPRAKHVDVWTWTPGPSDAAYAELWGNINRILVFANLHRDDPSDDARKVHHVLALISEAADRWYDGDRQPRHVQTARRVAAGRGGGPQEPRRHHQTGQPADLCAPLPRVPSMVPDEKQEADTTVPSSRVCAGGGQPARRTLAARSIRGSKKGPRGGQGIAYEIT